MKFLGLKTNLVNKLFKFIHKVITRFNTSLKKKYAQTLVVLDINVLNILYIY